MHSPHIAIADRADFFAKHFRKDRIRSVTRLILFDLEISINCEGFDFLEILIPIACRKPAPINMEELYCDVMQECPGYSANAISTAIEESIRKAWKTRDKDRWGAYFPDYVVRRKKKPANKEFVKAIVYFIDMWQDSYRKEAAHCDRA